MTELPDGWVWVKLEDAMSQCRNGLTYRNNPELAGFPVSRIETISKGEIDFEKVGYGGVELKGNEKHLLNAGDILFSHINSMLHVGKVAIYKSGMPALLHGMNLLRITPNDDFMPEFLFHVFQSNDVRKQIWSKAKHAVNQASINIGELNTVVIPKPPIKEQQKIVELLEDHLSRLDAALNDLLKARRMCSSLLAASFKSIVESVPHSYRPLSEVVQKIEAGKSFNCLGRPAEKEEWGVIKVSAMTWGEFLPAENKAAPLEYNPPPHHKINVGDILFSRANTQKYVGAAVRVKKEPGKLLLSDKSLRIIPKSDYDASWLLAALSSPVTREQISKRATGNEDSMRNISQKNLLEVLIPVPIHQDGQSEIVESLSLIETGIASNLQIIEQNLLRINWFRRSLLNKAFTGQLTNEVVSV